MTITKDKIAQMVNDKINKRANKGIIKFGNTLLITLAPVL